MVELLLVISQLNRLAESTARGEISEDEIERTGQAFADAGIMSRIYAHKGAARIHCGKDAEFGILITVCDGKWTASRK